MLVGVKVLVFGAGVLVLVGVKVFVRVGVNVGVDPPPTVRQALVPPITFQIGVIKLSV